jgi:hypothetical protein
LNCYCNFPFHFGTKIQFSFHYVFKSQVNCFGLFIFVSVSNLKSVFKPDIGKMAEHRVSVTRLCVNDSHSAVSSTPSPFEIFRACRSKPPNRARKSQSRFGGLRCDFPLSQ